MPHHQTGKAAIMIQSTAFGSMTIDGRTFHSDLIIFPDGRVQDNWWRKRGHVLAVDDIRSLADTSPEVIVAGTGTSGRMRPDSDLQAFSRCTGHRADRRNQYPGGQDIQSEDRGRGSTWGLVFI